MKPKATHYQVIIKVVDNCGRKIKELVEQLPATTRLHAVIRTGEIIRGNSKDATLIFQITAQDRNA